MVAVEGFPFPVHTSPGAEERARVIAERAESALAWLSDALETERSPELIVADRDDWARVASVGLYGMPHAFGHRVVTGVEPAGFWRDIVDVFWPHLGEASGQRLRDVYGDPPDLGREFPDLVVAHELTHVFHEFDEVSETTDFPRLWLAELFANLGMHGYVADCEPERLPFVQTICQAAAEVPANRMPVSELNDMGRSFDHEFGVINYCWYEFRLLIGAERIWDAAGVAALRGLYAEGRGQDMTDTQIQEMLDAIHPEAGAVMRDWPG